METVIDRSETQVDEPAVLARRTTEELLHPPKQPAPSIESIIQLAIERGTTPEQLEKLLALQERAMALRAEQQFNTAFAAFKAECPPVPRRTPNNFFTKVNRDGVKVPTMYASLEDIAATVSGPLSRHGLSYRWGDATIEGGILSIPCIISHVGGHSSSAIGRMPLENNAGCSPQQKYAIAETYAMRRSQARALGLSTCDEDNDGNAPPAEPAASIDASQAANLKAALEEVKANIPKFLDAFQIKRLEDLPAARAKEAFDAIERKRRGAKA